MLDIIIVVICLCLNAFFSAYEMAFVTISREEMEDLDEKPGIYRRFSLFKKKPERTLSVIQVGITLVGAIAAAVGGTGAVESLEPFFVERWKLDRSLAEAISVTLVIVPLTYFTVVFGELLPKTIALKYPLRIIALGTRALSLLDRFLSPVVTFLEASTSFLLQKIGAGVGTGEDENMGQIIEIGNLPDYHQRFVQNLVDLKGRKVVRAMIDWDHVQFLNFSDSEEEVREKIYKTPKSRFPVIDEDVVVGVLLKKELSETIQENSPWQGLIRPLVQVKENVRVLEAFLEMQRKQVPLAVVLSQQDKIVGIITIEDILEEIVGDIKDRADYSMASRILSNRPRIKLNK